MSDLWQWIFRSLYEDESRREYYAAWRQAMDLDESDPRGAIALLDAIIARTKNSGDAWWELFLEHWKLQILLNKARDFGAALDCAARATVEARKGQFADFPQRVCLHEDLISAYQGLDPKGYAPLIQNALDYMEREIAPGLECESCHRGLRAEFYRSVSHPDAVDAAWDYLRIADERDEDFHRAQAYMQLCFTLAVQAPQLARQRLTELAGLAYDTARRAGYSEGLHEILMWQALAARWIGEPTAKRAFLRAKEARGRYGAAAKPGYYVAGVHCLEAEGDLEGAVQLLDEELQEMESSGEFWREATRRVKKCELMAEMGLDWSAEAAAAREVAAKLKNPVDIETLLAHLSAA